MQSLILFQQFHLIKVELRNTKHQLGATKDSLNTVRVQTEKEMSSLRYNL